MKQFKSLISRLWRDESGQGTAEYVLILVAIVGVGMLFKDRIRTMLEGKLGKIATSIDQF